MSISVNHEDVSSQAFSNIAVAGESIGNGVSRLTSELELPSLDELSESHRSSVPTSMVERTLGSGS